MKKTLTIILAVLTISAIAYAETKIGVISPQAVITQTIRGKQVKTKLENLQKSKKAKMSSMNAKIQKLEKELISPALKQDVRERKAAEVQSLKTNLKRYIEDSQKELNLKYNKEMKILYDEIMPIIKDYGKKNGFTVIFDVNSSGISFFDQTIDITNAIIKIYNSKVSK